MSTVRYYRWDDPGAPTLTGEVGSLTNLLRKCLVGTSGVAYGSKPSAGWSEAFTGAASNIAVFRNSSADGASRCYVRVNDNAPGAGGAREAQIAVYASMTDINTGVGMTKSPWVRKSGTVDSTARRWIVIADGKTAWVYVYRIENVAASEGLGADTTLAGFGDYACVDPVNSYRYFCMGRVGSNAVRSGIFALSTSSSGAFDDGFSAQALDGISGVITPWIMHPLYVGGVNRGVGGSLYGTASTHEITGDNHFENCPRIYSGTMLLGRLRGLKMPYQKIISNVEGEYLAGYSGNVVVKARVVDWTNAEVGACLLIDAAGPWP